MQFTHYDTSVLTPIVALDENDTRENNFIVDEYEEETNYKGYEDDDAFETEGSF